MARKLSAVLAFVSFAMLGGCAVGNTHTFNYVPADRSEVGEGRVVLLFAVDDQRPYVLSGDEPANFVGEQRSGYGIPFNVTTTDKRPFAQVVQETAKRDLEAAGFRVTPSSAKASSDVSQVVSASGAVRALMIVMREFKSDTFNNINFDFDFEAIVYDSAGKELARNKVAGEEELEGSLMNPPKAARQKVPQHFYSKIHTLITGDPEILQALTR